MSKATVALIGFGTVGLGWAATYLAKGFSVNAYDPSWDAGARAADFLNSTWPALRALNIATDVTPPLQNLSRADHLDEAVRGATFIHESGPEDVATKQAIYDRIEVEAKDDAIIASSSGGLRPSDLQAKMRNPERMLIVHPFNPPHLVPLVEVIGGKATSKTTVEVTISHLRGLAKHPIRVDKEQPGYLTNRLQFALLREAIHCLVEGIAPLESIEDAMRFGLAPRWLAMGSLTTLTLAGGEGGMKRMLDSFAPTIEGWWEALGNPRMTPEVRNALAAAAEQIVPKEGVGALIAKRDQALVSIIQTLASIHSKDPLA